MWYMRIPALHRAVSPAFSGFVGYRTTFFSPAGTGMLSGQRYTV